MDDDTAIRALYDRYRRPLFGYVLRSVGGDHQYAEDIVQETMARAWAHAAELDPDRAGRWLFTVARNLVISGRRKRAARVTEVAIEGREFAAPGDDIDRVLQAWQVAEVLRGLSHDHLQVIVELFYRRRTVAEAAVVLGIPPGTVKSRSYYALHALRAALEERGVTGS
ncbi:sigma-70 family RNA polymerase sigma factor [Kribbella turkmenica]|uniref:Sigma-70 family RNA polymerase sigma factor n=1 Tax=Kribbella turkmenica TaxID=2530375 RepID=A0A4R4WHU7_9ACTN|nr:sigma-70 family RNA polymerase sigma factor [Kribbella turkmenica]TDD16987.1 sigma-70 family RNA polymerase sigma factor [Kribbella turkmenica]